MDEFEQYVNKVAQESSEKLAANELRSSMPFPKCMGPIPPTCEYTVHDARSCPDCGPAWKVRHALRAESSPPVEGSRMGLHPLDYQAPDDLAVRRIRNVTVSLKEAWNEIEKNCPPSAERTLALRSLQEARSRANEAILGITIPR